MPEKRIAIIGAGIAGLAAGCYAQMNGYRTQVFELHNLPGGLCTSWKRQGYTFDGCIHWLVGSGNGNMRLYWEELGALKNRQVVNHEEFFRIEGANGKVFVVYTDVDRLERHMRELAPGDSAVIREFCDGIRLFSRFDPPVDRPGGLAGILAGITTMPRMLPFLPALYKWSKVPMDELAGRFQDPFLRECFKQLFGLPDFPVIGALMTLAWMNKRDAGYPIGGSLEFARAIERRYLDLGGEISYGSRVAKILVENDRAVGVRLADGTEHRADVVVSAADGHATLFDMLDGKYLSEEIRGYYEKLPIFRSLVQVSLGVARDLSNEPHQVSFPLAEPITIAGEARTRITYQHYSYDPTLAPAGKSALVVLFDSDYAYWQPLAAEPARYAAEKREIADKVIAALEKRFPGIAGQVEVVDVATPHTYVRYTNNWQGSMEGWLMTTKTARMSFTGGMRKTLPGLENFHMVGQWVEPGGGLPPCAMHGRSLAQFLCSQDRRPFVTSVA